MRKTVFVLVLAVLALPALAQTHRFQVGAIAALQSGIVAPTPQTWYIRPDGGSRYSVNMPTGQCDGKADVSYASTGGTGINQHCAYKQYRYMWDDKSGLVGLGKWVILGGDTIVIRGCSADPGEVNPSNPNCRIGWDAPNGTGDNLWCYGVGSYYCSSPPIPAGTTALPTRILGQCAFDGSCTPGNLGPGNLTQLFGGFSLVNTFNLQSTHDVLIAGIELATHNGKCTWAGIPAYPRRCNNNQPLDDYAQNGFFTDSASANITLRDVYIHGFNASGIYGPLGGAITMIRVASNFNGFAGWNFDAGVPNGPGSSITARYVTMIGNGCYEEYPIKHAFPCQAAYDDASGGFGDAWSGQDTGLDFFICDHCDMHYNMKDGFIGPHTQIKALTITKSTSYGNGGEQWKWGTSLNATTVFLNNETIGNCQRMSSPIPGSPYPYGYRLTATPNPGAYLGDQCRAAGDMFSFSTQAGSTVLMANNTNIGYNASIFDLNCGVTGGADCSTVKWTFVNNLNVGYPYGVGGRTPNLYYITPGTNISITSTHNIEYGMTSLDVCGVNGNQCSDPLLLNEPGQGSVPPDAALDNFNFNLSSASPAIGAGVSYPEILATDFSGAVLPALPPIGALALAAGTTVTPPPPPPPLITPTITWMKPASIVFGAALTNTQLNATTSVPGTFTYAPAMGSIPAVGTDTLSVTFMPTDTASYTGATAAVQMVVTQPPPPPTPAPKAFTFTITHSETITCTPTLSGSTYKWTCK
jgi:hypothetical protein